MQSVLIEREASQILRENGLEAHKSLSCGFNRDASNPNPDVISFAITKDKQSMFIFTARTTLSAEDIERKNYGVDILESCLNYIETNENYQTQLNALMTAMHASNNASSQTEYDEYVKICEELNRYTSLTHTKTDATSCIIDIELLEANKELIAQTLKQLKELEASKQAVKA